MDLSNFTCINEDSILDALKKIDANKKNFLIVLNEYKNVIGTITDGDIRRTLIKGNSINDKISKAYNSSFKFLNTKDTIGNAIEIFKNDGIKFLPIVDNNKLINIITKPQLQSLLLQDIDADLQYDFSKLDENIINSEVFSRPWGFYKTTVLNDYYQSKVISIKPNEQLSLQSHNHRDEYWIITHGHGLVTIGDVEKKVEPGNTLFILRKTKHRIKNINDYESLIITEVQLGDYFGEDDIVRFEDKYGRK